MPDRNPVVYIIDDDPSVCNGFKQLLNAHGYDARPFASAREFMAAGIPAADSCLLIDFAMPEVDGLELVTIKPLEAVLS